MDSEFGVNSRYFDSSYSDNSYSDSMKICYTAWTKNVICCNFGRNVQLAEIVLESLY